MADKVRGSLARFIDTFYVTSLNPDGCILLMIKVAIIHYEIKGKLKILFFMMFLKFALLYSNLSVLFAW